MTTSKDFASYCCDLLASVGPCIAKRMFGGWGISTEGLTLAIIADLGDGERLWLKADDETRSRYVAALCVRFGYDAKGKPMSLNYYSAPDEAMDSPDAMRPWAQLALECALRARASKAPKRPTRKEPKPQPNKEAQPKASKPAAKRAKAPAPKTKAARKSAKGANTAAP